MTKAEAELVREMLYGDAWKILYREIEVQRGKELEALTHMAQTIQAKDFDSIVEQRARVAAMESMLSFPRMLVDSVLAIDEEAQL